MQCIQNFKGSGQTVWPDVVIKGELWLPDLGVFTVVCGLVLGYVSFRTVIPQSIHKLKVNMLPQTATDGPCQIAYVSISQIWLRLGTSQVKGKFTMRLSRHSESFRVKCNSCIMLTPFQFWAESGLTVVPEIPHQGRVVSVSRQLYLYDVTVGPYLISNWEYTVHPQAEG